MKLFSFLIFRITVMSLLFLLFTKNAYAYLDMGTGSYIIQMLIAGLLGSLFAIKIFWKKIIIFIKNLFSKNNDKKGNK